MSSPGSYPVGTLLRHHAGSVWEVVAADLPGDGRWHGNMLELAGDYRIRCVEPAAGETRGTERRVHAEYLHRDGWRQVRRRGPVEMALDETGGIVW
jgi:hypothetical protein